MKQDDLCLCPTECDCQNPPPDDPEDWDGAYGVSNFCPIHNNDPEPLPECPLHGHPEPASGIWKARVFERSSRGSEFGHPRNFVSKQLYIEELGRMLIAPIHNRAHVIFDFTPDEDCTDLGEVEVPKELMESAIALARAHFEFERLQGRMNLLHSEFRALLDKSD